MTNTQTRIENELEVSAYLQNLQYALNHDAKIDRFTVADLFPNENPVVALRRELQTLTVEDYIKTVKDLRFPRKSEMREFGKVYTGKGDVYIKIRVELLSGFGNHTTFVMSFHYAEIPFTPAMFPHRKQ